MWINGAAPNDCEFRTTSLLAAIRAQDAIYNINLLRTRYGTEIVIPDVGNGVQSRGSGLSHSRAFLSPAPRSHSFRARPVGHRTAPILMAGIGAIFNNFRPGQSVRFLLAAARVLLELSRLMEFALRLSLGRRQHDLCSPARLAIATAVSSVPLAARWRQVGNAQMIGADPIFNNGSGNASWYCNSTGNGICWLRRQP